MLLARVQQFIETHALLQTGGRAGVALSGGGDSVVLLYLLHRLGYAAVAMHVNYGLRGDASDGDEAFVEAYCKALGVPLYVKRADVRGYACEHHLSLQAAARRLRYAFFEERASPEHIDRIAVAHHLDDQAETVLLNLFRGSGVEGLAGMPLRRPLSRRSGVDVVRPLLCAWRHEIEAFAREAGLSWREDSSNDSLAYRRNALRNAVLPSIRQHFGAAALQNVVRCADLLSTYRSETFSPRLEALFASSARREPEGGGSLDTEGLRAMGSFWRRRVILEALDRWLTDAPRTAAVADQLEALLDSQVGRCVSFKAGTVWRARDRLHFVPCAVVPGRREAAFPRLITEDGSVRLPKGIMTVASDVARPADLRQGAPHTAFVDANQLEYPLTVRPWQAGDRFQPLGMMHTKKVSDFLTDEKVPVHERKDTLVVLSGERIVWIVGLRLAEGVKVGPATCRVARFSFRPA